MLFLFYIILTLIFCIIVEVVLLLNEILDIADGSRALSVHTFIRGLGLGVQIAFLVVISMFFKFHV